MRAITDACATAKDSTDAVAGLGAGAIGFRTSRFSADSGSEYYGEVAGVVRVANTVTVVGLRAMVKESDVDMAAFDAAVVRAAERAAAS